MKRAMILVLVGLVMLGCSSYAAAYSPRHDGRSDAFEPGRIKGYTIWQDKNGLHAQTTIDSSRPAFGEPGRVEGTYRGAGGRSRGGDDFVRTVDCGKVTFVYVTLGDMTGGSGHDDHHRR